MSKLCWCLLNGFLQLSTYFLSKKTFFYVIHSRFFIIIQFRVNMEICHSFVVWDLWAHICSLPCIHNVCMFRLIWIFNHKIMSFLLAIFFLIKFWAPFFSSTEHTSVPEESFISSETAFIHEWFIECLLLSFSSYFFIRRHEGEESQLTELTGNFHRLHDWGFVLFFAIVNCELVSSQFSGWKKEKQDFFLLLLVWSNWVGSGVVENWKSTWAELPMM